MQYRSFGKIDFQVSALGFGAMRLPTIDGKAENIDEKATSAMLEEAISGGVNYVDTAYPYHEGNSEKVLGKILKENGLRERVMLATKQPCWLVNSTADFDRFLDEQLAKLQTDRIEVYLLHALYGARWERMQQFGVLEWAESALRSGKIRYFGFSFHDGFDLFKKVVDSYERWSLCQIQYNYMNENVQAGRAGISYAAARDLAVVVMEPLLGGALARPPAALAERFAAHNADPADLALQWLWNQPEVSCVLSGMSTLNQVRENLKSADRSGVGLLDESEEAILSRARDFYLAKNPILCTRCRYCMPCPKGVNIPYNLELYSEALIHDKFDLSKSLYTWHLPDSKKASACTACKACEKKCPQHIPISELMPRVDTALAIR